jgi:hypothetical protein
LRLPQRDPRPLSARSILQRPPEDILDLLLNDTVSMDVWLSVSGSM